MAWYPKRDERNKVIPEFLCFPKTSCDGGGNWHGGNNFYRQKRWGASKENRGPGKRSIARLLVDHARNYGYLNGHKINTRRV